ncbi:hypothetical protein GCM10011583_22430 [Streptomyces camponoticapitis]|uniref:Uncharacterized protein n=1 Tax=Streptomyces camponoticapitis TaxID=1616125 RepID=A0ABQ2E3B3_9ACTN|nr:hypothetical protein GCM10011583_22430 [Streptomyces camponoticapitis]
MDSAGQIAQLREGLDGAQVRTVDEFTHPRHLRRPFVRAVAVVEIAFEPAQQRDRVVDGECACLLQIPHPFGERACPEQRTDQPAVRRDDQTGGPGGEQECADAEQYREGGAGQGGDVKAAEGQRCHDRQAFRVVRLGVLPAEGPQQGRGHVDQSDEPDEYGVQPEAARRQLRQYVGGRPPTRAVPQPCVEPPEDPPAGAERRRGGDPLSQEPCGERTVQVAERAGRRWWPPRRRSGPGP